MNDDLRARLADVDARISDAARSAGRDPSGITRIVVTKFHPAALVRELHGLGVRDVGENRQQELTAKVAELSDLSDLRWHFVGQAQTNKARAIRAAASTVHSVDRSRLADALDAAGEPGGDMLDVLVQVNLTDDPGRGGTAPGEVAALAEHIAASCPTLRLRGVMGVAPLDEPAASAFARLAEAGARVRTIVPDAEWISAGMTGDFAEAIAAGATHLRIGSAITGPRPVHG
ncbi:YggS family pyridoxal phosphate-dependent enzyme [Microbacterium sp. zg.Y1090]|uniref:YggS family pyridoxal phosphate-dependent enzyme n=1 Tax=Microbacterium TaxID=33882 RepID=UPI00214AD655|nr:MULTISPECIES: YggS family pyridoxal phosphate-dependent enzyme [unclassified Microbacterium]MCR2811440.1 YggS family pyridoxal phosphate-dependent enzyme [Microbacterium sp. zg.Y1084]MCR2819142.1 YggS family pyridoxal phosphate-dependent enzyme [Microbacterium sp. zg.Y1090]MDL5487859.1 YggS family pyridoxal phosphate-dependent enzyme [Microbacterium sp. zg-Y1211]WIM27444.1 YggS family pyridoxal phosphate-dependent enzyme [Microbacterium sp. zg-Y1090]